MKTASTDFNRNICPCIDLKNKIRLGRPEGNV